MPEISGSNSSTHGIGSGNQATRILIVPWANRLAEAEALLGAAHPDIPLCWCKSVRIEPFPDEAAFPYLNAKITAEYATDFSLQPWPFPKPSLRANTSLSIASVQIAGEFLRIPARSSRWADNRQGYPEGPLPEDDSPAGRLFVAKAEITLQWDYVDVPPFAIWNDLRGKVNQTTFLGCEPETLLFSGYELAPSTKASVISPWTWRLMPKFLYRAIKVGTNVYGWNHEYRPTGWQRVLMFDGTDWVDRYAQADFSGMFS